MSGTTATITAAGVAVLSVMVGITIGGPAGIAGALSVPLTTGTIVCLALVPKDAAYGPAAVTFGAFTILMVGIAYLLF